MVVVCFEDVTVTRTLKSFHWAHVTTFTNTRYNKQYAQN